MSARRNAPANFSAVQRLTLSPTFVGERGLVSQCSCSVLTTNLQPHASLLHRIARARFARSVAAVAGSVFVGDFMFGRCSRAIRTAIGLARVHFAHAAFVRAFLLRLFDNHPGLRFAFAVCELQRVCHGNCDPEASDSATVRAPRCPMWS